MLLLAQKIENPVLKDSIKGIGGVEFMNRAIPFLVSWLLTIGFLFFLVYFILGGIHFIQSAGDKNKVEEAKHQLTNAIIGIAVVFLAMVVTKLIGLVFGIENLQNLKIILPTL